MGEVVQLNRIRPTATLPRRQCGGEGGLAVPVAVKAATMQGWQEYSSLMMTATFATPFAACLKGMGIRPSACQTGEKR